MRLTGTWPGQVDWFVPRTLAELDVHCQRIERIRPSTVIVAGGDGTIMRTLSSLDRAYGTGPMPSIVLLPFGTFNTTTRRCGVVGDPWALLERHLSGAGSFVPTRFLRVEVDSVRFRVATLGTGLVSNFFEAYESTERRGLGRALSIFGRVFVGSLIGHSFARKILAPVPGRLDVDGQATELRAFTLLVCSVFGNVGLGLRPTYRARERSDRIHLVATDLCATQLGPQACRVLRGRPLRASNLVDRLAECFQVYFDAPSRVVLDGDSLQAETIRATAGSELLVWHPR